MESESDGGKSRMQFAKSWSPEENDDWTWFTIVGFVNSKDLRFGKHRSLKVAQRRISEAVADALMKNGFRADRLQVVIDQSLFTLDYARDLGIEMTLRQEEDCGAIRRFIRRLFLRLYRLTGGGLSCALDPFTCTDAATKNETPTAPACGVSSNGHRQGGA